jgi:hypothetical protein
MRARRPAARQLLALVSPFVWHESETQTGKGPAMRSSLSNEIEYLADLEGATTENPRLIREMSQRLDALRRFDQSFCDADCRPHSGISSWEPDSSTKSY